MNSASSVLNRIIVGLVVFVVCSAASAQTIYIPAGTVGASSNSNVGIGTSSPASKLTVWAGRFQVSDGTNSVWMFGGSSGGLTAGHIGTINNVPLAFFTNSSGPRMTITPDGKVGIGESAPSATLAIASSGGQTGLDINASGGADTPAIVYQNSWMTGAKWSTALGYDNEVFLGTKAVGSSQYTLSLSYSGNVGIGTSGPTTSLHVASSQMVTARFQQTGSGQTAIQLDSATQNALWQAYIPSGATDLRFWNNSDVLVLQRSGNVGIGTNTPSHKLSVNGTIKSKEVIVETTGWSDYVFAPGYELQPLSEVEAHIKEHQHLPGIPSAKDVAEQGVTLGEMQAKLLAKIEELTLHVIAQQKQIRVQLEMIEAQSARLRHLEGERKISGPQLGLE